MNIDRYIDDGQDPKVVEKLLLKLQDLLAPDEHIRYVAAQKTPGMTLFPDSIAVTDQRVLVCKSTKLGLASQFEIFSWHQLSEVWFKEGIVGSRLILIPTQGDPVEIGYIPKNQARKVYQWAHEALENYRSLEKQRLEQLQASTNGANEPEDELTLKLEKLKSLFERQLITQEEYESKKIELLSQL